MCLADLLEYVVRQGVGWALVEEVREDVPEHPLVLRQKLAVLHHLQGLKVVSRQFKFFIKLLVILKFPFSL